MVAKDPTDWNIGRDGGLKFKNRLIVPNTDDIRKDILEEAHRSRLTVHPGGTKMYKDLKRNFWWEGMKREVANFVSKCLTCQQVKLNIKNRQDYCSHCRFRSGNGSTYLWTSWWVCLDRKIGRASCRERVYVLV